MTWLFECSQAKWLVQGRLSALKGKALGPQVVGVVDAESSEKLFQNLPVFESVERARQATGAMASLVLVSVADVADSVTEALCAGLKFVWSATPKIPLHDRLALNALAAKHGSCIFATGSCGFIMPDRFSIGPWPNLDTRAGGVALVSTSTRMLFEGVSHTTAAGFGQSVVLDVGPGPLRNLSFEALLTACDADEHTERLLLLGFDFALDFEELVLVLEKRILTKPVSVYVPGLSALKHYKSTVLPALRPEWIVRLHACPVTVSPSLTDFKRFEKDGLLGLPQ